MSENIKVSIDPSTGQLSVECREGALDAILTRLEKFIPNSRALPALAAESTVVESPADAGGGEIADQKGGKRKGKTKLPVYKMADLGVDDEAKRAFKKFFDAKKPKVQNDQVTLCAFWLNKTLGRETFTDDDVFTALRAAGAPKIPPRIESVISNLKLENKLVGERAKYKITHIGEDFVNNDLPAKDENG